MNNQLWHVSASCQKLMRCLFRVAQVAYIIYISSAEHQKNNYPKFGNNRQQALVVCPWNKNSGTMLSHWQWQLSWAINQRLRHRADCDRPAKLFAFVYQESLMQSHALPWNDGTFWPIYINLPKKFTMENSNQPQKMSVDMTGDLQGAKAVAVSFPADTLTDQGLLLSVQHNQYTR